MRKDGKMTPGEVLLAWKLAFGVASGAIAMGWFRKGSAEEDEMVVECHDMVLDSVSDADATKWCEVETGENWRDQLSVEEAESLNEERELRRFGWRRN